MQPPSQAKVTMTNLTWLYILNLDTDYLWDNSGNNFGWITPNPIVKGPYTCGNPNTGRLAGYTGNHPMDDVSITTSRDAPTSPMIANGGTLTSQAGTAYALNTMSVDEIVDDSLTLLIVHELTHTLAVMGVSDECRTLRAIVLVHSEELSITSWPLGDFSYGEDLAYGWRGVTTLAGQSTQNALFNAGKQRNNISGH
jgi:hypothetical protein